MLSVLQHLTSQKLESAKQFHPKWRKERQNIYSFFEDGKVTTKQKQFSEEKTFYLTNGLNQFINNLQLTSSTFKTLERQS